jgi:hypothetical protein
VTAAFNASYSFLHIFVSTRFLSYDMTIRIRNIQARGGCFGATAMKVTGTSLKFVRGAPRCIAPSKTCITPKQLNLNKFTDVIGSPTRMSSRTVTAAVLLVGHIAAVSAAVSEEL